MHLNITEVYFKNICISLFAGLIGSIIFVSIYTHNHQNSFAESLAKSLAIVRMDLILTNHLNEYAKKDLSKEERDRVTKKFALALEKAINDISQKERVILLVAPAAVSKLPDYTDRIESEIKRALREVLSEK
ncbi:MAG: TrbI F-type domain-containing protein [Oligoflexia bacterium]|nr:TrbI F-type domain-containing protein [Oligoflexia bacterium]